MQSALHFSSLSSSSPALQKALICARGIVMLEQADSLKLTLKIPKNIINLKHVVKKKDYISLYSLFK